MAYTHARTFTCMRALTELPEVLSQCSCFNNTEMLPPSTTTTEPTWAPGSHERLNQENHGRSYARPPSNAENDDVRITDDDVIMASTTRSPHKTKTTTKPEFYEEDSIGKRDKKPMSIFILCYIFQNLIIFSLKMCETFSAILPHLA